MNKVIMLLLCEMISVIVANAQAAPPYADACNPCKTYVRSWETIPVTKKLVSIEGCSFWVYFKTRLCASAGCQEMKVLKVSPFDPIPCPGASATELATLIIGQMIINNDMNFEPDTMMHGANGCWSITRPACWTIRNWTIDSCEHWEVDPGDTVYNVTTNYNDLIGCDQERCCTNVLYPTIDGCGNVIYSIPPARDYVGLFGARGDPPSDPEDLAAWEKAHDSFDGMFSVKDCIGCGTEEDPMAEPEGDPQETFQRPHFQCFFDCPEDIIKEYKKLLNKRLKMDYGE